MQPEQKGGRGIRTSAPTLRLPASQAPSPIHQAAHAPRIPLRITRLDVLKIPENYLPSHGERRERCSAHTQLPSGYLGSLRRFPGKKKHSLAPVKHPSTSRGVQGDVMKVFKPQQSLWVQSLLSLHSTCCLPKPWAAEYARGEMFTVFTLLCFVSTNSLGNDKYSCAPGPRGAPTAAVAMPTPPR